MKSTAVIAFIFIALLAYAHSVPAALFFILVDFKMMAPFFFMASRPCFRSRGSVQANAQIIAGINALSGAISGAWGAVQGILSLFKTSSKESLVQTLTNQGAMNCGSVSIPLIQPGFAA